MTSSLLCRLLGFSLLLLALLSSEAVAQLRITGSTTIERDKMGRLIAEGADDAALIWDFEKEDQIDVLEIGNWIVFVGPPGTYRVKCRAIRVKDGKPVAETARVTVTITPGNNPPIPPDPRPEPGPGPRPDPVPPTPPTPVNVKDLWILIIEETAEASERRGQFFANKELADRMKARGHKWRSADKDARDSKGNVPADLKPWLDLAKGKKMPRLFLITPAGIVVHDGELPATPKGLLDVLTKVGG